MCDFFTVALPEALSVWWTQPVGHYVHCMMPWQGVSSRQQPADMAGNAAQQQLVLHWCSLEAHMPMAQLQTVS